MTAVAPIRVTIIEDDAGVRESLAILLNGTAGFCCLSAFAGAHEALEKLPFAWPDVVLMDINMPRMSGIEAAAKLKALRSALQILMLTVYLDNHKIFNSLMAGASGYLLKQTPPAQILEAIAEVHRGGSPMSGQIARKVVQFFQQQKSSQATLAPLTEREHEILTLLAQGYQYKEIADHLSLTVSTVRNHLQNIYGKLHVRSRTEAVVKYLGQNAQCPSEFPSAPSNSP